MVTVKNLSFSYPSQEVLKDISMEMKEGCIYGLLGENGVGKTTLLTLLCGLKKPAAGSIDIEGRDPYNRLPSLLADQFYLPDEVEALNEKAFSFAASRGVFYPNFSADNFKALLEEFEVDGEKKMNTMSAGQLKKTWIAFALATGVKYYYLDEPTNGLDIPSKAQFRKSIMKYAREDATFVISTHQVRDLENIIDPIIILDRRDVLVNATVQEITSKFFFDYGNEIHEDALYVERIPGGCIQVRPNTTGEESKINIEAFFNTVHSHKELVKSLLA
ncbi:MAG: ATP-binding cassette domain-containing protein [Bacteroidales bacterium]|nr:ATP-binding cassette domain-containing protein [Bacteroidales bacterium]